MTKLRFVMALHNHQPVGNFEGVIEDAYKDSYCAFLDVIESYPHLPFALHTSGCLMEWLADRHPEYIDRLRTLVQRGQTEIIGGAYYEPILPMIPSRDRIGQIRGYSEYLRELFGCQVRGMWLAERVWEQHLVSDIAQAGIEYTILDDFHFRKAGLRAEALTSYFLTEDEGRMLRIFPGSEPARYLIPFQEPDRLLEYLRGIYDRNPESVVVFADDGEKFGTWPETKTHVYTNGWIHRFLDALTHSRDWIEVCTLSQALDERGPAGQVFLPDCSYREMTEWALPADRLLDYQRLWHDLDHSQNGGAPVKEFLKGGFWRNFKARYSETNEMYSRMLHISNRLERLCEETPEAVGDRDVHKARQALYRGQCNCPYWHGAFGGLYLPHLRNAVYGQLIEAENHLNAFERGSEAAFVEIESADLNFDGLPDIRLANDKLAAFFNPANGGHLYELDVRSIQVNVGGSLTRRPEAYHEKVRKHTGGYGGVGSIHDRVVFKQPDLDKKLGYDSYQRKSLIDHFWSQDVQREQVEAGIAVELGDFVGARYRPQISRREDRAVATLSRTGAAGGGAIHLSKTISLSPGEIDLRIRYRLEDVPPNSHLRFGVEFNVAALASGADDRYFLSADGADRRKLGRLESSLGVTASKGLILVDEWLGIEVGIVASRQADFWTFPVQSVSQSEGGFELVHQSACVVPNWPLPVEGGVWEVELTMALDTAMAESRRLAPIG